jgi:very-short-patch-repair endonuclease
MAIGNAISNRVYEKALMLKKNLPRSERWFWKRWRQTEFYNEFDMSNEPFLEFIPDVINHKYKYIIEVNGKAHENRAQIKRDIFKKALYKKNGYKVFSIKAGNDESFSSFIENVKSYLDSKKSQSRVILRKANS